MRNKIDFRIIIEVIKDYDFELFYFILIFTICHIVFYCILFIAIDLFSFIDL